MKCKFCGSENLRTIDSRPTSRNTTRRRKTCLNCGQRFSTYEMTAEEIIGANDEFRNELKEMLLTHINKAFDTRITDMEVHGRE